MSTEPLDPADVAALIDGTLKGDELKRVQSRLADDPDARRDFILASRMVASAPVKRNRIGRFSIAASLVAAAAIAFVFLGPSDVSHLQNEIPVERTTFHAGRTSVEIISPGNAAAFDGTTAPLVWRALPGASYHVAISDSLGQTVYQTGTSDTSVRVPVALKKGARYFWSVDALEPDGNSATSGPHEFIAKVP